jgi:rubrerythrin
MKKYIDIDLAKESLLGWYPNLDDQQIEYMLDTIPAANVMEVKHGEWIGARNIKGIYNDWFCSVCGYYEDKTTNKNRLGKRCPECGAKMDGGKADVNSRNY